MNNALLTSIIQQKKTCYFISPHFDDAVFSAGSLISFLSKKTKVVVINVFTKPGEEPYTLSVKAFLKQCRYADANTLFVDRENEDAKVLNSIVDEVCNLGFVDALWRRKAQKNILSKVFANIGEFQTLYPTYRFHVLRGKIVKEDEQTVMNLQKKLAEIITIDNSVIFCPLATGNHIDHVITRVACEKQFSDVIYWTDFPYSLSQSSDTKSFASFQFNEDSDQKKKLMQGYISQYEAMFKNGLSLQPETFYFSKQINK